MQIIGRKVIVDRHEVSLFNAGWPGSSLRPTRAYWWEFAANGDLIDTDVPEQDDSDASAAMADDCRAYLMDGMSPPWRLPV